MQTRRMGRTGLYVTPICFGGNVLGWTTDQQRSFEVLDTFVAGGGNFIDYTSTGRVDLQAPTSNHGVTSIQGGVSTSVVPEPTTYLLVAAGLAGILVTARRRRSV